MFERWLLAESVVCCRARSLVCSTDGVLRGALSAQQRRTLPAACHSWHAKACSSAGMPACLYCAALRLISCDLLQCIAPHCAVPRCAVLCRPPSTQDEIKVLPGAAIPTDLHAGCVEHHQRSCLLQTPVTDQPFIGKPCCPDINLQRILDEGSVP